MHHMKENARSEPVYILIARKHAVEILHACIVHQIKIIIQRVPSRNASGISNNAISHCHIR